MPSHPVIFSNYFSSPLGKSECYMLVRIHDWKCLCMLSQSDINPKSALQAFSEECMSSRGSSGQRPWKWAEPGFPAQQPSRSPCSSSYWSALRPIISLQEDPPEASPKINIIFYLIGFHDRFCPNLWWLSIVLNVEIQESMHCHCVRSRSAGCAWYSTLFL